MSHLPMLFIAHSKRFYTLLEPKDEPVEDRLKPAELSALKQLEPVLRVRSV